MKPTCPERFASTPSVTVLREIPFVAPALPPQVAQNTPDEFDLPDGGLWATTPRTPLTIHCLTGQLWITQAGNTDDIVLLPGDTHTLAAKGRVVIQALTDARIALAS